MGLFDFFNKDKDIILGVEFPKFKGKMPRSYSKNTEKYKRKDYYFKKDEYDFSNYIDLIYQYGFTKLNDIKYIKNNSYIIIENEDYRLHIAFHVNK